MPALVALLLTGTLVGLAAAIGGLTGLFHLALWVGMTVAGLPLGLRLFGPRHALGWFAGALFGYVVSALAIWAALMIGATSWWAMPLVWLAVTAAIWYLAPPRNAPRVALPPWTRRDTLALLAFLWLVPLLAGPAFLHVGAIDSAGNRLYRAYFTADFLWHTGLTAELARFELPPTNPFLAHEPLHYYWTYFLPPAAVAGHLDAPGHAVEQLLLVNALAAGVVFFGVLFLAVWAAVPRAFAALAASLLAAVAASGEGAFSLWRLWQRHLPLAEVKNQNIDAVANWAFDWLRIDGLPRSLWYVPQHAMGVALGLVALVIAGASEGPAAGPILASGFALGAATIISPMIGAAFSLAYGLAVLLTSLGRWRDLPRRLARHALAAGPVVLALAWCAWNNVLEGASAAFHFGYGGLAPNHPGQALVVSLGPLLVAALAGLVVMASGRSRAQVVALAGAGVGFAGLFLVYMPLDLAYVGFRAGQVLQVTLPMLAAGYFAVAARGGWRRWAVVASALGLFAWGAPTSAIDAFNAQDIGNRAMGPGFHWTVAVTPDEESALKWIERHAAPTDIVQPDPVARGRETWTLIPSLAQRRMAAGLPISLLQRPEYEVGSRRVHELFRTTDLERACFIATALSIDFLYFDDTERSEVAGPAMEKFDRLDGCFRLVFRKANARVYRVTSSTVSRR